MDNSLTRWKNLFLKFFFREIQKVLYENPTFRLGKLNKKYFFALKCHYNGDTPYRVWFDLDNSLTQWKKPIFKIPFREIQKVLYENPTFFS